MGRPGITGADVVRAYVALKKQGREPTLSNLRLELGRGSFTTIAARLESLSLVGRQGRYRRAGRPSRRGRPPTRKTPPELSSGLGRA